MSKIAGRYEITAKLGEGGMGVVYRAYDPHPVDREVAVKTLHHFADPLLLDLFYKECRALKSISHPNIVEIFDMGEFEDGGHRRPFFVMPLLAGQTLDELIRTSSHRLTVDRVIEIVTQTCRGLQAAHDHGLIHRDLKPSNIFVMADDSVKIIDFGIAHAVHAPPGATQFDKGTLLYMSPEQVQHKPVSVQSDIYSLGVAAYEALTRRQPFRRASEGEVIEAILGHIPPPASELNPSVSQLVSRVVHKALAKQPWNRYDTAKEFADTLQKANRNEPIALFDPSRIQPRLQTAARALEKGDAQFAGEIVTELEAEGNINPEITLLRTQIDQTARQKTIAQLLESARARYEEDEGPLALQKVQEVLALDSGNVAAIGLKGRIEDRRSEKQIENWMQLARRHMANRSYAHAREAVQNALALRPKDARAARLLNEIEGEEREYARLRQEKTETYHAAVNAWKNGEISHALSQMTRVLEIDRLAPDSSSPDMAGVYQSFYDKIRSEHEALNSGYVQARRHLADKRFAQATAICEEFLEKYPGQALFQALKFDVEDHQRQQLSALIADVDRRFETEQDLDTRVNLLREAASEYPQEGHFARLLKLAEDKRDLVNSIVERARIHEERGQISEALSDLDTLQTIHGVFPGLTSEKDRLQKRLEQHTRDVARGRWVAQVDQQLGARNWQNAIDLVDKGLVEFPEDRQLFEQRKLGQQGIERAIRAERLLNEGQQLVAGGEFDRGVELLEDALQLDDHPTARLTLLDVFVAEAQATLEKDWRRAAAFADRALELEPTHAPAQSLRAQAQAQAQAERAVVDGDETSRATRDAEGPDRGLPQWHEDDARGALDTASKTGARLDAATRIISPPLTDISVTGAERDVEAFSETVVFRAGPPSVTASEPADVQLVITDSPNPHSVGQSVALSAASMVIGREGDWLPIADTGWSRQHAAITFENGGFLIADLGSSNGTRVNGIPVQPGQPRELFFGSRISIGDTVLTFSSARATTMPDLTGCEVDGRYILEQRVRGGSKAALYMARDKRLPGRLAVKLLSPRLSGYAGYSGRFQQQAELARQLQHPHICQVLDYGYGTVTRPGVPPLRAYFMCLVMMDGGNLADRLEKGVPERSKVIEWIQRIGSALDYAHRHDIVHGDIKPTAIVFDTEDNPYLTDFAVVQHSGGKAGYVAGAPAFMAPEQWESRGLTPASDQFSLAALSYFLLTGSRPFEGQDHPEIRRRNFARGPLPAHTEAQHHGRAGLPRGVSHVLERALLPAAHDRYNTIAEFTGALSSALIRPPRRPDAGQVFLSYHRETLAGWVNYFAAQLRARSLSIYLDTHTVQTGPFPDLLAEAIEDCAVFVCFVSEQTLASNWIQFEISLAYQYSRPMIPIFLEGYVPSPAGPESAAVKALLMSQGIHLQDRRNLNVEGSVADLAMMIQRCVQNV